MAGLTDPCVVSLTRNMFCSAKENSAGLNFTIQSDAVAEKKIRYMILRQI
jgi:hypothetical protein